MNAVIKASVILVVLVALLSLGIALSGLHRSSPIAAQVAFLIPAILINAGCVFWGLKQTAAENGYGKQLGNAALIGVIAGILIFCFSFLMLTVLLPNYLDDVKQTMVGWLEDSQMPQAALDAQIKRVEAMTPIGQAFSGLMGTFFTSAILGALMAIFLRKK